MTQLEKIVAEAKKIRKAHPKKYAKWTDYIKAASKKIKPVKKVAAVKRKATKAQHKDLNTLGKLPKALKKNYLYKVDKKKIEKLRDISTIKKDLNNAEKDLKISTYIHKIEKDPLTKLQIYSFRIAKDKYKIAKLKKELQLIKKAIK